jgi:deoxyadenosine/deoxycytidine kinase
MTGPNPERFINLSPEFERRQPYVEFIGVPASCKTTVVRDLGSRMGFAVQEEIDVTKWPIFGDYYKNPQKYALEFQKKIFRESLRQVLGGDGEAGVAQICQTKPVFHEPILAEHPLYSWARLGEEEYRQYEAFIQEELRGVIVPRPNLVFYHYMDPEYMLERIRARAEADPVGRGAELDAPVEYWLRLWQTIHRWVYINPYGLKIVKVNMRDFDYKNFSSREACNNALAAMLHGWIDHFYSNGEFGNEKKTI